MNITKAINRLIWRFSPPEGKRGAARKFQPNETDIRALNEIIEHVNQSRAAVVEQNRAFAKMYIMAYGWFLDHYGTQTESGEKIPASIMEEIPEKELHKALNRPLALFYRRFAQKINDREAFILQEEIKAGRVDLESLTPEQVEILSGKAWDNDTVTQTLNALISDAFLKFGIEQQQNDNKNY